MPAVDPGIGYEPKKRKPKREPKPSRAPRPAPTFARTPFERPFHQQQKQATQRTRAATRALPRPVIAAPPVIRNPTPRQVTAAKAQIVSSVRRQLGDSTGQERAARTAALYDQLRHDPRLRQVRRSVEHWQREEAKLNSPQWRGTVAPGAPHKRVTGPGPLRFASIDLTAGGRTLGALAARAAPGAHIGDAPGKFVGNAFKDLGTIATGPFVAGATLAGLGKQVVTGHPDRAVNQAARLGKAVVKGTIEDWSHPGRYLREHPVLFGLDALAAETGIGRTAGALARARGIEAASTVRPPLALGNDRAAGIHERTRSKDLFRSLIQQYQDSKHEKLTDANGNVVMHTQGGRQVPVLKPRDTIITAARHPVVNEQGHLNNKRADMLAARANSEERLNREVEAKDRRVRGVRGGASKAITAMVARGIITTAPHMKADLEKYVRRVGGNLRQHHQEIADGKSPSIYRHEGEVKRATENVALAQKVLASPKAMAQAERIVEEGTRHGAALVKGDLEATDLKLFTGGAEQARRARLVETAVHHMDAQHGTDPRIDARIKQARTLERSLRARLNFGHMPKDDTPERLPSREEFIANRPKADPRDTPDIHAISSTLRETGKPGLHIERDYKRFHERDGGGISDQLVPGTDRKVVARGPDGRVQGVLHVFFDENGKPDLLQVVVDPKHRGKGIASALYQRAEKEGWDVEAASGRGGLTEAGAGFAHKRAVARANAKSGQRSPAQARRDLERQLEATRRLREDMEARNTERLRTKEGAPLEPKAIEDFLRSRGRDPETVAYLPSEVSARQFHKQFRADGRSTLDKTGQVRTGAQSLKGAVENSPQILQAAGVRQRTAITHARNIDRTIGEHGMRHPAFAKAQAGKPLTKHEKRVMARGGNFTGPEAAEVIARAKEAGEDLVAVRAYPAKLDAASQTIIREKLQGPGGMDTLGQRLLNDRILTEQQLAGKARNVVLMNGHQVERLRAHLKPSTAPWKMAQIFNKAFRYAVLPQPRWVVGNFFEPLVVRMPGVGSGINVFGLAADVHAANRLMKRMDKSTDPKVRAAADEIRAHQFGGLLFGQRGLTNRRTLEDFPALDRKTQATYAKMVEGLPGTKQLQQMGRWLLHGTDVNPRRTVRGHHLDAKISPTSVLLAPIKAIFAINRVGEAGLQRSAFGKSVRRDAENFVSQWHKTLLLSDKALDEVAKGLVNTPTQQRFMAAQHELLGKYEGFSPTLRAVIQGPAPFLPWALNAARFVFWTMPAHRSLQTALLVRLSQVVQKDWDEIHKGVPPGMGLAIPNGKGGWIDIARYTPYGLSGQLKEGDYRAITGQLLPQLSGVQAALEGKDPFGRDLVLSDRQKASGGDKRRVALNSALEAMVPYLSNARRLQEHGETAFADSTVLHPKSKPGTSHGMSAARRVLDPFRPTYLTAASKSSGRLAGPNVGGDATKIDPADLEEIRQSIRESQQVDPADLEEIRRQIAGG